MTDIDFDELDRAVNSIMQPVAENSTTISNEPTPVATTAVSTPTPTSRPIVNNPRTGRFMDVVPPTVNTRVNIAPADTTSRQGNDINPVSQSDAAPVATTPQAEVVTDELKENIVQDNTPVVGDTDESKEDADIERLSDEINSTLGQSEQPIETPFISGTKVEKRPLGAFSEGSSDVSSDSSQSSQDEAGGYAENPLPVEDAVDNLSVESAVPEETLLDGQSSDQKNDNSVMEDTADSAPIETTPVVNQAETPVAVTDDTPNPIQNPQDTQPQPTQSVDAPAAAPSTPPAATSINQQYQEQPSTGDQTSGAIYDTNAYHKAVLQPVKKKSGWWMILWIFLLLVVGAGSGVAVYFFVLPNL